MNRVVLIVIIIKDLIFQVNYVVACKNVFIFFHYIMILEIYYIIYLFIDQK